MIKQNAALFSSLFTTCIFVAIEEILFRSMSRIDFHSTGFMRINIFSLFAIGFISNWISVNLILPKEEKKEKYKIWKRSLLYTLLFSVFLYYNFMWIEAHIQSGEPWQNYG